MKRVSPWVVGVTLLLLLVLGAVVAQEPLAPDTDNTVTRLEIQSNGSAEWTVEVRTRLETPREVNRYRAFQKEFRNNTTRYLSTFRTRIMSVVNASDAVGRQMTVRGFGASTEIQEVPRRWGVVSYRFVWTNFTAQRNHEIVVGDVFEGGFFISEGDRLQVVSPPGYTVESVDPEPLRVENGTVTWTGRRDFRDGRPRIVFAPTHTGNQFPIIPFLLGVLVLVGAGYYLVRGRGVTSTGSGDEIVTDEGRVIDLLRRNGGKMRQSEIVDELGWSKAKTSRVLSRLNDDDAISKLQLGRENVIEIQDDE